MSKINPPMHKIFINVFLKKCELPDISEINMQIMIFFFCRSGFLPITARKKMVKIFLENYKLIPLSNRGPAEHAMLDMNRITRLEESYVDNQNMLKKIKTQPMHQVFTNMLLEKLKLPDMPVKVPMEDVITFIAYLCTEGHTPEKSREEIASDFVFSTTLCNAKKSTSAVIQTLISMNQKDAPKRASKKFDLSTDKNIAVLEDICHRIDNYI
ncbi:hypothetical protein HOE31_03050 [bacterium]|jgi:hypothetical protein|nr:hypothetical protein [bacterium]MBT4495329.1 hypothetical protein [bacterium]MBT4763753.1 hypothetical protein [bacterium]MBT5401123.1 hypothetical protein [bacterium]MBT5942917.1 hypothetical protein [bacterium]